MSAKPHMATATGAGDAPLRAGGALRLDDSAPAVPLAARAVRVWIASPGWLR